MYVLCPALVLYFHIYSPLNLECDFVLCATFSLAPRSLRNMHHWLFTFRAIYLRNKATVEAACPLKCKVLCGRMNVAKKLTSVQQICSEITNSL